MSDSLEDYVTKGCPPPSTPRSQFGPSTSAHQNQRLARQKRGNEIRFRGAGCFSGCTEIASPTGDHRIDQLRKSNVVYSINIRTHELEPQRILAISSHQNVPIWSLKLEYGENIFTTATHSLLINNSWVKACDTVPGDKIYAFSHLVGMKDLLILESKQEKHSATVYNLIVENNYNFIANGVFAHSFTYFRALRMLWWYIKTGNRAVPYLLPNQSRDFESPKQPLSLFQR